MAGCIDRAVPPRPTDGFVLRPGVLERLSEPTVGVALINAPAGYGKTTHAAAFAGSDPRPVAWLDVETRLDDGPSMLRALVDALAQVTDLDRTGLEAVGVPSAQLSTIVAPALGRAVGRCAAPFVLVLDDAHRLADHTATALVTAVVSNVPDGSTVLLVGRSCRLGALPRLRVESNLVEIGADVLSLTPDDISLVLSGMGVEAHADHVEAVATATEGWPVGVRLAGLASLADEPRAPVPPSGISGHDPNVFGYIASEWLGGLADDERDFLLAVSVLDWLTGPACAAVSCRPDAGEVLHRLWSERLLLIPLDRRGDAYRLHALLRDALIAQLERSDPDALRLAHQRASTWFEAACDADRAIRHAIAAHDIDRAERLIVEHTPFAFTTGRYATISRWIDACPRDRVLHSPALCLTAALAAVGTGDVAAVSTWLRLGDVATGPSPDPDSIPWLCLLDLRSTTSTGLARPALQDAITAYRGLPPGIWHAASCLAYGAWSWTVGDDDAVKVLSEGAEEARVFGAASIEAQCTALLGIIAHTEGDLAGAVRLAARAQRVAAESDLGCTPGMLVVSALCSLTAAATGDMDGARANWRVARTELATFKDVSGWANVQTRVALAHASLLLGDRIGAQTLLDETREYLSRAPDAVGAIAQVGRLRELVGHMRRHTAIGSSALTTAELRVLHLLPTNLSLAKIGEQLYVSRYTVKTHCESIYRKLNVNSRADAVTAARNVGLLDPHL
jgi:LuxR family maltose regulon positive regulatory protein